MNARLTRGLARSAQVAYGLAAALAALTLWGWALDMPSLRDLGAHFPPMPPAAALGTLLLAGSFLAAERGRPQRAYAPAALAALIAALALAGLHIDLLFNFNAAAPAAASALMSPAAAIALLLLAIATPLAGDRKVFGLSASNLVAGVVGMVAFFALLGMSLRMLRFDLAAPLLGFSAPG